MINILWDMDYWNKILQISDVCFDSCGYKKTEMQKEK